MPNAAPPSVTYEDPWGENLQVVGNKIEILQTATGWELHVQNEQWTHAVVTSFRTPQRAKVAFNMECEDRIRNYYPEAQKPSNNPRFEYALEALREAQHSATEWA